MLYGLGITCLDRFLGRIFADKNGDAWDRYLQYSLLISRQFLALCGPAGCELCSMASVSPVWTAFWAAFFHNLCGQDWGCLGYIPSVEPAHFRAVSGLVWAHRV